MPLIVEILPWIHALPGIETDQCKQQTACWMSQIWKQETRQAYFRYTSQRGGDKKGGKSSLEQQ